jgi:bifunctional enzyme CysN/CysC
MTAQDQVLHVSTQFQATLAWLSETSASAGRQFDLKLSHQWTTATIYKIKHKLNLDTLMPEAAMELRVNEVYKIQFSTTTSLSSLPFADCRELGGFILVDRVTKETVAVGTLDFALRRGETVKPELSYLTGRDREQKFGHRGKVLWFTGLSGAGKSTLANNLERELFGLGIRTMILDGDNLRSGLNKDLGFSEADRIENIRRTAEVAKLMFDAGLVVIVAVISPFNADRAAAKELIGAENFMEVFVATPLDVCERRDPKGLYAKARSGVIPNLTGIGSPYEPPENPALTLDTSRVSLADSIEQLKQLVL